MNVPEEKCQLFELCCNYCSGIISDEYSRREVSIVNHCSGEISCECSRREMSTF